MVIEIPNQPISFIRDGESINQKNARLMWDRRVYCQLVKTSQTQQFQFQVTPETGINLVANGEFVSGFNSWTRDPLSSWQIIGGKATSTSFTNFNLSQVVPISANKTYKLQFDIFFSPPDEGLVPSAYINLFVFLGNLNAIGGSYQIDDFNQGSGTYVIYFRGSSVGDSTLLFNLFNANSFTRFVSLDNISLYILTEPILVLEDCNGNYIRDITSIQRFEDKVTYTHSWENETDGQCYKFCLYGSDNLSLNYLQGAFCLKDNSGICLTDEYNFTLNEYIK